MKYQLRPYQTRAIDATYDKISEKTGNPCIVMPTGTGKSLVIAQIVTDAVQRWGGRICVLAHRKELLEQNASKIRSLCPEVPVGIYSSGLKKRNTSEACIVAGIQSVYSKPLLFRPFDVLIVDEAHMIPPNGDGMYRRFIEDNRMANPNLCVIGLTATPYRTRGGLICSEHNILNYISYEVGIREMIAKGYLSKYTAKGGDMNARADMSDVSIVAGEFVQSQMEDEFADEEKVICACTEIVEQTADRQSVLIFCSGVLHAEMVVDNLRDLVPNERVEMVIGATPSSERAEILCDFAPNPGLGSLFVVHDRVRYLVNVGVLTTGFDAPNIDCVVLLRATASPGLYVQMVGRGSRIHEGKDDCLILDYGDNVLRHGPIDKVVPPARSVDGEVAARECPKCHSLVSPTARECPDCGYEFPEPDLKLSANHNTRAGVLNVLGTLPPKKYAVQCVYYCEHTKKDAPDDPKTLRVNYKVDFRTTICEWVCPEHDGWARERFERWWLARCSDLVPPDTAADAAYVAENQGALAQPSHITVDHSGKFDRIIEFHWDRIEEPDPYDCEVPF